MNRITSKQVKDYISSRTDAEIHHCTEGLAAACNRAAIKFNHDNALDLLKLLCFNDYIPALHRHSYNFNTATGRYIINKLKQYCYEYKSAS